MKTLTKLSFRRTWRLRDSMSLPRDLPWAASTITTWCLVCSVQLLKIHKTALLDPLLIPLASTLQTSMVLKRLSRRRLWAELYQDGFGSVFALMADFWSLRQTMRTTLWCQVWWTSSACLFWASISGSTPIWASMLATRKLMSTSSSSAHSGLLSPPTLRCSILKEMQLPWPSDRLPDWLSRKRKKERCHGGLMSGRGVFSLE